MSDWYPAGLEDDMRPRMFAAADRGEAFALVTIVAAEGGGPRGVGAQMVVTADDMGGFLSGGCIEADVALHARETLASGEPRRLVYGRGSPFVDARLPCGGRLELLVERLAPDDGALTALREAWVQRRAGVYVSDGQRRTFGDEGEAGPDSCGRPYAPPKRLIVFGSDAFALAIAAAGMAQGWAVVLCRPKGPEAPPPLDVTYSREEPEGLLSRLKPDAWTAVATATHEGDLDHAVLKTALLSDAGYVGVLGARRRLPERLERLRADGVGDAALMGLKAPIGLAIGARSPAEVAASVTAEIIASLR
ncbi:XdhC family protein [Brevundimonas sp. PAMC22021]|uniref:XdhC family protein n=1 Tax=Brevundimonas sp. PAMC22021 TaxID=2861285 RepID=UPI001C63A98F|nr:XdhC family protein [Brevundimonas sp. PAMC22021]QYF87383.1 XdhC family protein [Brevundimonas sp. PAMC22021]